MTTDFRTWVTYLGNSDLATYTFPFKVKSLSDIVVVQLDVSVPDEPTIDFVERCDVQINVPTAEFDAIMGGGSITFAAVLPATKRIYIKLASDEPTQTSQFREQIDFKLVHFEWALDFIVNQTTRLTDKTQRGLKFADHFSHVESVVNLEMQEFPMAFGIPIMSDDALQLEMKPILTILEEAGVLALIATAQADADGANTRLDVLEPRVTQAEADIDALQAQVGDIAADAAAALVSANNAEADADQAAQDAAAAAASAAAAVGASVSNRVQVIPYAPMFDGALVEEEYDIEVCKLGVGNRVMAFTKMSQYFITGRPIKVGFAGYSTTSDSTSKYKLQMTATLVKDGVEVTSTVNEEIIVEEVTVSAVASALKIFSFEISPIGEISGVAVDANDGIKLEFKRIDASSNEDVALIRLLKQTFELSFA